MWKFLDRLQKYICLIILNDHYFKITKVLCLDFLNSFNNNCTDNKLQFDCNKRFTVNH